MFVSEILARGPCVDGYAGAAGHYDEVCVAPHRVRPHWRRFFQLTGDLGADEFGRRWEQARRLLHQNSLTYPDPSDPTSPTRHPAKPRAGCPWPWELDPVPLLLGADEWRAIAAALRQRAALLDLVLRDLYGPRQLLERGILPA